MIDTFDTQIHSDEWATIYEEEIYSASLSEEL